MAHVCEIEGVTVQFPFEPYGIQRDYMASVIRALKQQGNALLESPTGTGKTLSLQCAALGWREWELSGGAKNVDNEESKSVVMNHNKKVVPIFYAARTHSQLSQIAREQREVREPKHVRQLGSRTQFCSNPVVQVLSGGDQISKCTSLMKENKCEFVQQNDRIQGEWNAIQDGMIADIEGIMEYSRQRHACGYYLSRQNLELADVYLVPYNYLLDATIRRRMGLEELMKGGVVIFDEAHNLASFCCENTSHELSLVLLSSVLGEIEKVKTKFQQSFAAGYESQSHELSIKTRFFTDGTSFDPQKDQIQKVILRMDKLKGLNNVLRALEGKIGSLPITTLTPDIKEDELYGKVNSGEYLLGMLHEVGIHIRNETEMRALLMDLEAMQEFLSASTLLGEIQDGLQNVDKLASISEVDALRSHFIVFAELLYKQHEASQNMETMTHYKCTVEESRIGNAKDVAVKMMCFSSSVAMSQFKKLGVRSVLITSGTLAPIDSFKADLGIPIQEVLENKHIVDKTQLQTFVLSTGPSQQRQDHSYKNRNNNEMRLDTGRALLDICKATPGGVQVFFASYPLMDTILTAWGYPNQYGGGNNFRNNNNNNNGNDVSFPPNSLLAQISQHKIVCREMKTGDFNATLEKYNTAVHERHGGILFGVSRGKASEGVDFRNSLSRAVVIIGLPFPALGDNRVIIKRNYHVFRQRELSKFHQGLAKCKTEIETLTKLLEDDTQAFFDRPSDPMSPKRRLERMKSDQLKIQKIIDDSQMLIECGRAWYEQEAFRAVNQAVGRVIRHRHDYGTVYFLDERFNQARTKAGLCKWLQPFLPNNVQKYTDALAAVERHWAESVPMLLRQYAEKGVAIHDKPVTSSGPKRRKIAGVFAAAEGVRSMSAANSAKSNAFKAGIDDNAGNDIDYSDFIAKKTTTLPIPMFQKGLGSKITSGSNNNLASALGGNPYKPVVPTIVLSENQQYLACKKIQWNLVQQCLPDPPEFVKLMKNACVESQDEFQRTRELESLQSTLDKIPPVLLYRANPHNIANLHPYILGGLKVEKSRVYPEEKSIPLMEPVFRLHNKSSFYTTKTFFTAMLICALPIRLWDHCKRVLATKNAITARVVQQVISLLGDELSPFLDTASAELSPLDMQIMEQEKLPFSSLLQKVFSEEKQNTFRSLLGSVKEYQGNTLTLEQRAKIDPLMQQFHDLFISVPISRALANKMTQSMPAVFKERWEHQLAKLQQKQ